MKNNRQRRKRQPAQVPPQVMPKLYVEDLLHLLRRYERKSKQDICLKLYPDGSGAFLREPLSLSAPFVETGIFHSVAQLVRILKGEEKLSMEDK